MEEAPDKPDGVIKYSGDQQLYAYWVVDGNRVSKCVRVGDGLVSVVGLLLNKEILDDLRRKRRKIFSVW